MRKRGLIVLLVTGLLVAGCASKTEDEATTGTTTRATIWGSSEEAEKPSTTSEAPTTTTTVPPPEPINYSGFGDDIIDITMPVAGEPAVMYVTHGGARNFAVWTLDQSGGQVDLSINTIGGYQGIVPVGFDGTTIAALEITADGGWEISVIPLALVAVNTGEMTGTGDNVVAYIGDATRATIAHQGERNFAVWVYPLKGRPNLAVNEIGPYTGTVRFSEGFVVVTADGAWTITPE